MARYDRWDTKEVRLWAGYLAAVVAGFAWLEWRGMRKRNDDNPTLTGVFSRYVPEWLMAVLLGAFDRWFENHMMRAYESWREPETYDTPR